MAFSLLREFEVGAGFFVTTETIGESGFLAAEQIREMADAGMTIGSHGCTHRFLETLNREQQKKEIQDSCETLKKITGKPVRYLSLPGGRFNQDTGPAAKECGIQAIFTSLPIPPYQQEGVWWIGRVALRHDWSPSRLSAFLEDQETELEKLQKSARMKQRLQKLFGPRLYPRLHHWFWKIRGA